MWLIASDLQNSLISYDVNCVPLSLTIISGKPCWANSSRSIASVCRDVVLDTVMTSAYFDQASTTMRNCLPKCGRSKSMWSRSIGFVGGGHECIVALRGCFDDARKGRIDGPLLQILCLFPASTLTWRRVSSFVGFLEILELDVWELWSPVWLELPHVPWTERILYRSWGPLSVGKRLRVSVCWRRRPRSGQRELMNFFTHWSRTSFSVMERSLSNVSEGKWPVRPCRIQPGG
jgi:hypothetical protein